jgi:hypothetical protein
MPEYAAAVAAAYSAIYYVMLTVLSIDQGRT